MTSMNWLCDSSTGSVDGGKRSIDSPPQFVKV